MYKKAIKDDAFTSWMKFFNLTNNKDTLDYADTVKAIVLINFTMEEFIIKKEELEELVEKGSINRDIVDKKESYIDRNIIYMPAGLNIHFHDKKGSEYNQYIYNVCSSIMMENINVYFNEAKKLLSARELENIEKAKGTNLRYNEIIDRIMKLLYLFDKSDVRSTTLNEIYRYISYSIRNEGIMLKTIIKEILEVLLEKSYIDMDLEGNYFIISELKKDIRRKTISMLQEGSDEEVNKFTRSIIRDSIKPIMDELGDVEVTIYVGNEKIHKASSNLNIKIDFAIDEERDTRKGYYILTTRQCENMVFWYSKKDINLETNIKWFIAYSKAVDFYIDSHGVEFGEFLKREHENRMLILRELREEILKKLEHGTLVYDGKEKIMERRTHSKEILIFLLDYLEKRNRFRKILNIF